MRIGRFFSNCFKLSVALMLMACGPAAQSFTVSPNRKICFPVPIPPLAQ